MARAKKQPMYEYGIEITRPWSQEMYTHNDAVLAIAKRNIQAALDAEYDKISPSDVVHNTDSIYHIAKEICGYGFSHLENQDVYDDACIQLHNSSYHRIHEIYPYLEKIGFVEPLEKGFVGYSK